MENLRNTINTLSKYIMLILWGMIVYGTFAAAQNDSIRLLLRGDDIGSSHTANVACIESYREGIVQSIEVMVPCPWFNEAAMMLRENPGLDVGVHLTLTSEWEFYKWGPLTQAPSLVDERGNFLPMTSQRDDFPPIPVSGNLILNWTRSNWNLERRLNLP